AAAPVVSTTQSAESKLSSVGLGRPVALSPMPVAPDKDFARADSKIVPASFTPFSIGSPQPVIRAQSADAPQPMPLGPTAVFQTQIVPDSPNKMNPLTQEKPEVLSIAPKPVEALDHFVPPPGATVVENGSCCTEGECECGDGWLAPLDWLRCRMPIRRLFWAIPGGERLFGGEPGPI